MDIEQRLFSKYPKISRIISGLDFMNVYFTSPARVDISNLFPRCPPRRAVIKEIIVHHTAIRTNAYAYSPLCEIYQYHIKENYGSIAYHYYIDKRGIVYQLHIDTERTPHAEASNDSSLSVCTEGDFDNETLNQQEQKKLVQLLRDLCDTYHLAPETAIKYHGEVCATSCPGKLFINKQTLVKLVVDYHFLKYITK